MHGLASGTVRVYVCIQRIVATKAKTPAKRPSHLTTGHALSPSPLVIGRVKNLVTSTTPVNKVHLFAALFFFTY